MPRRRVSSGAWPDSEDEEAPARKTVRKGSVAAKKQKRAAAAASQGQQVGIEWAVKHQPRTEADLCALVDPKRVAALKSAIVAALQGVGPRLIIIHGKPLFLTLAARADLSLLFSFFDRSRGLWEVYGLSSFD